MALPARVVPFFFKKTALKFGRYNNLLNFAPEVYTIGLFQ